MTLIIAISCKDGVVIAADSATSDPESGTKQLCNKIKQIGKHPILYGGSGDVGLLQKINERLSTLEPKSRINLTRKEIKRFIFPEIKESTEYHVRYPQPPFHLPPVAILLFAGVHKGRPWILEIERDGRDTLYDEELGNFAAIGSGKPLAQAIFRLHLRTERDLKLGKIFAYRIVDDSINIAANLARPIQMHTISLDGTIHKVLDDELDQKLAIICETWRQLERDAVGEALAPPEKEKREPEIPKPELNDLKILDKEF